MGIIATKLFFKPPAPSGFQYDEFEGFKGKYLENQSSESDKTILFCHDSATDLSRIEKLLQDIKSSFNCHVLGVEYSGFPEDLAINPTEETILNNVDSAIQHLRKNKNVAFEDIILMGHGLGCSAVVDMGLKYDNLSCILFAPFMSFSKLYLNNEKLWNLPGDMFQISSKFSKLKGNVIIVHGKKDEIVPIQHSISLVEQRPFTPLIALPDANHNDIFEMQNIQVLISTINTIFKTVYKHQTPLKESKNDDQDESKDQNQQDIQQDDQQDIQQDDQQNEGDEQDIQAVDESVQF